MTTLLLLPVQSVGFESSQRVPLRSFLIEALPDETGFIVPTDQVAANCEVSPDRAQGAPG